MRPISASTFNLSTINVSRLNLEDSTNSNNMARKSSAVLPIPMSVMNEDASSSGYENIESPDVRDVQRQKREGEGSRVVFQNLGFKVMGDGKKHWFGGKKGAQGEKVLVDNVNVEVRTGEVGIG
jgi:hypothetical protein